MLILRFFLVILLGVCVVTVCADTTIQPPPTPTGVTTTPPPTTPAPTTNAPIVQDSQSVHPVAVAIGVLLLLILFGLSFYFVVVWPKRSMMAYRQKFEDKVNSEGSTDHKEKNTNQKSLYGGAAIQSVPGAGKKIPTYREIEVAMQKEKEQSLDHIPFVEMVE